MADDNDRRENLLNAREFGEAFNRRLERIIGQRVRPVDSIVRFLRQIPADDKRKKEELAAFFQTQEGQQYDKDERRAAYDDLLGRERNKELRG